MYPGQVNGNWVVYSRCGGNCQVFRYDIVNEADLRAAVQRLAHLPAGRKAGAQ